MRCPHCKAKAKIASELACGDIWSHEHGMCLWFSLSPDPGAPGERWDNLADAWQVVRDQWAEDDAWAMGWDAYFAGRTALARRLWRRYERQMSPAY